MKKLSVSIVLILCVLINFTSQALSLDNSAYIQSCQISKNVELSNAELDNITGGDARSKACAFMAGASIGLSVIGLIGANPIFSGAALVIDVVEVLYC